MPVFLKALPWLLFAVVVAGYVFVFMSQLKKGRLKGYMFFPLIAILTFLLLHFRPLAGVISTVTAYNLLAIIAGIVLAIVLWVVAWMVLLRKYSRSNQDYTSSLR